MATTYQYTRTHPDGAEKSVGSFKTPAEAQRFLAQALVDNGYADRSAATTFARTVTLKSGPQTHSASGIAYAIVRDGT